MEAGASGDSWFESEDWSRRLGMVEGMGGGQGGHVVGCQEIVDKRIGGQKRV